MSPPSALHAQPRLFWWCVNCLYIHRLHEQIWDHSVLHDIISWYHFMTEVTYNVSWFRVNFTHTRPHGIELAWRSREFRLAEFQLHRIGWQNVQKGKESYSGIRIFQNMSLYENNYYCSWLESTCLSIEVIRKQDNCPNCHTILCPPVRSLYQ